MSPLNSILSLFADITSQTGNLDKHREIEKFEIELSSEDKNFTQQEVLTLWINIKNTITLC